MTESAGEREAPETALRIYTLAVEMADRVSARRAGANSFFLALQTALAAALGAFAVRPDARQTQPEPDRFVLVLAVVTGIILATAWFLLRSYRKLNRAKFEVIGKIEDSYFKVKPFSQEWQLLKAQDPVKRRWRDRYTELGFIEQAVPIAFVVLYLALAVHLATR